MIYLLIPGAWAGGWVWDAIPEKRLLIQPRLLRRLRISVRLSFRTMDGLVHQERPILFRHSKKLTTGASSQSMAVIGLCSPYLTSLRHFYVD
jgi:hypothetical protein